MPSLYLWWVVRPGGQAESARRLRFPMVKMPLGRVGCRRSWYWFAVEIGKVAQWCALPCCAHSFT
jgi:hypothetical protein